MLEADPDELGDAELRDALNLPSMLIRDLQRQAIAAATRSGDSRTAVVMAATSCETLVDLVLAGTLWEEGSTPEAAAVALSRYREITARMHRMLAPRLGGVWDEAQVEALYEWRVLIANSRNRVVHGGSQPSRELARRACDAMLGFSRFLLDRLCATGTRNRYPMTCLIVGGRSALQARGGWTAKMRAAADEGDALDLQGVFARWYDAVSELRLPQDMRRQADEQRGWVNLVKAADGTTYWIERDTENRLARLVTPLDDQTPWVLSAPSPKQGHGRTYSFDDPPQTSAAGPWVMEHRLVPGTAVMRNPDLWYLPPTGHKPYDGGHTHARQLAVGAPRPAVVGVRRGARSAPGSGAGGRTRSWAAAR